MKKSGEMNEKVAMHRYNKLSIDRELQIVRAENEIRVAKFDGRDNSFLCYSFEYDISKLVDVSLKNKISDIDIVILIERVFLAGYLSFIKYVFEVMKEMMFHVNRIGCFKEWQNNFIDLKTLDLTVNAGIVPWRSRQFREKNI